MSKEEIKQSIIKMYEPLKDQDLEYYEEFQKIIDYQAEIEDRIQKAIEYIEKNYYDTIEDYKGYVIATIGVEELLDILKGSDKQ